MEEQKLYFANSDYYITMDNPDEIRKDNTPEESETEYSPTIVDDIEYLFKEGLDLLNRFDSLILNYKPETIDQPVILTNDRLKYYYICSKIDRTHLQLLYATFLSLRKLFKYFYFYNPFEDTLEELYYSLYKYHLFEFDTDIHNEKLLVFKTQFKNPVFLNFIHYLKNHYNNFTTEKNKTCILGHKKYFMKYGFNTEENEDVNLTFTEEPNPFIKKYVDYPTDTEDLEEINLTCQEKFDNISEKIEEMQIGH